MKPNILVIGGNGLVGQQIIRIFKARDPTLEIFAGGRKEKSAPNSIVIDVNKPETFEAIVANRIGIIILSVNDPQDHVLNFTIAHQIDYIDITKPTPDLVKSYALAQTNTIRSRIIFGSGWMGGIVASMLQTLARTQEIQEARLFVYYSIQDLAGESSAHFMAENVAKPFYTYRGNKAIPAKHFLDAEQYTFHYGIGKRQTYNFDVPDLYILNQIEKIPNVAVKTTYSSRFVTWFLRKLQQLRLFDILSLHQRRKIFSAHGSGDQTVFELLVRKQDGIKKIALKSAKGQAELTALSAVLHAEQLMKKAHDSGIYFAHQLHQPHDLIQSLQQHSGMQIETLQASS